MIYLSILGKKNTTCCQCCSHKTRSALFKNICSKSFEPALNTITWFYVDFMLISTQICDLSQNLTTPFRLATVRFRTLRTMFEPEPNIMFGVRFSKTTEHEPEWRFRFSARANPNILFRTEHFRCSIGPERNKSWCIFCIYSTLYIHSTCYIHYI